MARVATIIDRTQDLWGDEWDVREYRQTTHGFPVALGWPHGHPRGKGGGGVRVIVTPRLAQHFETHRLAPAHLALPIGNTTVKRIRRLLGHHQQIDRAAWWEERIADLSDLTLEQFAAKHSVSTAAAAHARHAFFGHKLRPAGWWRRQDAAEILLSYMPRSEIAEALDISVGSVGRLRWLLRALEPDMHRGISPKSSGRQLSLDEYETIATMILGGMAVPKIASTLNLDQQRIYKAIQQGRLPRPQGRKGRTHPNTDKAVEMVRNGSTYKEAARSTGMTGVGVWHACKRAGVVSHRSRSIKRQAEKEPRND